MHRLPASKLGRSPRPPSQTLGSDFISRETGLQPPRSSYRNYTPTAFHTGRTRGYARLADLGARVTLRAFDGTPFLTDQGNHILDAAMGEILRPAEIAAAIASIPGVVEHGLFLDEIDTIMIGRSDTVEVRHRAWS